MEDKIEIQNNDFILPGDLGIVRIASSGSVSKITKIESNNKDGSVTMTLSSVVDHYLNGIPLTEDAEFEVVEPKMLENKPEKQNNQSIP